MKSIAEKWNNDNRVQASALSWLQAVALLVLGLVAATASTAMAQSWPTYRHDNRRSGVTDHKLKFPLSEHWVRRSAQPPQAAWSGPAKWDAWSGNNDLQSMRNFDPCFFVTVASGSVYFGSSVDDAVHSLDAETGSENWAFFTAAAVRFPPTIADGRVYFGSDDGTARCCDAKTGDLVWSRRAAADNKRITSDRKIISLWPIRTGVLVHAGKACFAGSLVPWERSYLWSVDAATGEDGGDGCYRQELSGVTLQGAMLAFGQRMYLPQGRAAPLAFDLRSGDPLGAIGEAGGVFCILTEDEMLLAGPPNQKESNDQIRISDGKTKQRMATFSGTNRILVSGEQAWIPSNGKLKMLDRTAYVNGQRVVDRINGELKKKGDKKLPLDDTQKALAAAIKKRELAWRWQIDCPHPTGFIKSGGVILLGLRDEVRAYSAADGKLVWQAKVDGMAHGLAVAEGRLFVSTGRGHIYAFGAAK